MYKHTHIYVYPQILNQTSTSTDKRTLSESSTERSDRYVTRIGACTSLASRAYCIELYVCEWVCVV